MIEVQVAPTPSKSEFTVNGQFLTHSLRTYLSDKQHYRVVKSVRVVIL